MTNDNIYLKLGCLIIIAALVVIKTVLFLNISGRKKFNNWFHFDVYHLVNSRTVKVQRAKHLQNVLTNLIFIATALVVVVLFLFR